MVDVVEVFQAVASLVGTASAIAALFPKAEKLGAILGGVRKVIDLLALNVGNAKNK